MTEVRVLATPTLVFDECKFHRRTRFASDALTRTPLQKIVCPRVRSRTRMAAFRDIPFSRRFRMRATANSYDLHFAACADGTGGRCCYRNFRVAAVCGSRSVGRSSRCRKSRQSQSARTRVLRHRQGSLNGSREARARARWRLFRCLWLIDAYAGTLHPPMFEDPASHACIDLRLNALFENLARLLAQVRSEIQTRKLEGLERTLRTAQQIIERRADVAHGKPPLFIWCPKNLGQRNRE